MTEQLRATPNGQTSLQKASSTIADLPKQPCGRKLPLDQATIRNTDRGGGCLHSQKWREASGLDPKPNWFLDPSYAVEPFGHLVKPMGPFPEERF